jgi:hypothetical protein
MESLGPKIKRKKEKGKKIKDERDISFTFMQCLEYLVWLKEERKNKRG